MATVTLQSIGNFKRTHNFLDRLLKLDIRRTLNEYGAKGVKALQQATPKRTGKTANSWSYEVTMDRNGGTVSWSNSNVNKGVPIAIIIEYGHGTGWGGYVPPQPYIKQALESVYQEMSNAVWKEVENG